MQHSTQTMQVRLVECPNLQSVCSIDRANKVRDSSLTHIISCFFSHIASGFLSSPSVFCVSHIASGFLSSPSVHAGVHTSPFCNKIFKMRFKASHISAAVTAISCVVSGWCKFFKLLVDCYFIEDLEANLRL